MPEDVSVATRMRRSARTDSENLSAEEEASGWVLKEECRIGKAKITMHWAQRRGATLVDPRPQQGSPRIIQRNVSVYDRLAKPGQSA